MAAKHILDRIVDPIFDWGMSGGKARRYTALFMFGAVILALLSPALLSLYFLISAQEATGVDFFYHPHLWISIGLISAMLVIRLILKI